MTDIKFTNAAKYFDENNKAHLDAFDYLQTQTSSEVVAEFEKRFRAKPAVPPADEVPMPGIALIKEFEGCRLNAYPDPLTGGEPITCGWGNTRKKDGSKFKLGDKLTQAEADELLIEEVKHNFLPALKKIKFWNEMNANQRGALLSFAYNLGAGFIGDTDNFGSINRALSGKDGWTEVPAALYKYRNPGSNVEAGLARRRTAEGNLWKQH
jgi:lysozyme